MANPSSSSASSARAASRYSYEETEVYFGTPPEGITEADIAEAWFEASPPSSRRSSTPPPVSAVGEFLGDPLADAWLR
ncbi:MAG: hypothetical protein JWP87_6335 [Labilithrix sp.]|nr:hypothetical protein [Labilithrix sp.]